MRNGESIMTNPIRLVAASLCLVIATFADAAADDELKNVAKPVKGGQIVHSLPDANDLSAFTIRLNHQQR